MINYIDFARVSRNTMSVGERLRKIVVGPGQRERGVC